MQFIDIIILFSTGLAAGFLSGYLGIGGGVIVVPVLLTYFSGQFEDIFLVVSTISLGVVLVAASKASYHYIKSGKYYKQALIPVGLGALLGPIPGNFLCGIVCDKNRILFFAAVTAILAVKLILKKEEEEQEHIPKFSYPAMFFSGLLMGMISAMTGTGGGFILVPLLVIFLKFNVKKAVGVSSIVMIANPVTSLIGRYFIGAFDNFPVKYFVIYFLLISFGTLLTSKLGVNMNIKSSTRQFKYIAGSIYFVIAVQMYIKAY